MHLVHEPMRCCGVIISTTDVNSLKKRGYRNTTLLAALVMTSCDVLMIYVSLVMKCVRFNGGRATIQNSEAQPEQAYVAWESSAATTLLNAQRYFLLVVLYLCCCTFGCKRNITKSNAWNMGSDSKRLYPWNVEMAFNLTHTNWGPNGISAGLLLNNDVTAMQVTFIKEIHFVQFSYTRFLLAPWATQLLS